MVPVVDLVEIGNGGGSIAWVDDFGKLHVGPRSAGADPGPAAYGRGGTEATTTDASLALGRINAGFFCGGEIDADMDAVDARPAPSRGPPGVGRTQAARGVVRIANNNMINALKLVSTTAATTRATSRSSRSAARAACTRSSSPRELAIRRVVIPHAADVFSAWGMLMSDLRRDFFVTRLVPVEEDDAAELDALLREVAATALAQFAEERVPADSVRFVRYGTMRYENQEHGVEVPLPDGAVDAGAVDAVRETFHAAYEREYTYRLDAPIELVGVHLVAIGEVGKLEPAELVGCTNTISLLIQWIHKTLVRACHAPRGLDRVMQQHPVPTEKRPFWGRLGSAIRRSTSEFFGVIRLGRQYSVSPANPQVILRCDQSFGTPHVVGRPAQARLAGAQSAGDADRWPSSCSSFMLVRTPNDDDGSDPRRHGVIRASGPERVRARHGGNSIRMPSHVVCS